MSARYGSRTRSGEAVSDLGRRATGGAGGVSAYYEQEFTAPGTWTNPGTVTEVLVFAVGGGGGGGNVSSPLTPNDRGGGGGGGRVIQWAGVPVSGPVPVTVGAGGLRGLDTGNPSNTGQNGGTSYFGPAGPGPVPAIPVTTVAAGGGGGGGFTTGSDAPPIGGGGGGGRSGSQYRGGFGKWGGTGGLSGPGPSGRSGGGGGAGGGAFSQVSSQLESVSAGYGVDGFGGGGSGVGSLPNQQLRGSQDGGGDYYNPTKANSGGGGAGGASAGFAPGSPGAAGIVIVGWYE